MTRRSPLHRHPRRPAAVPPALLALLALLLTACGPAERQEPAPGSDPGGDLRGANLLLVTVDTLRADRVGAYGHAGAATPHLDALAAAGVRVRDVYAPVPLTLPSHAVLFTGRQPFQLGVRVNGIHELGDEATTLAEVLRGAGYTTAAAVSAYVLDARFGLDQGFDHYDDRLGGDGGIRGFDTQIRAEEVVGRTLAWLATEPPRPWFAWVHLYDPHLPYDAPGDWGRRFAAAPYDGEVAYADHWIGRLLAALDDRGLHDDTLVVVTSDHGEAFGEHGEEGHGLLVYDESLRVPLILRAPGRLPAGRVVERRVHLVDLAVTLLDLLGVAAPPEMSGRSAAAALTGAADGEGGEAGGDGEGGAAPRYGYFESLEGQESKNWAPLLGVMDDRFKLISAPKPELYDLRADPGETENVLRRERRHYRRLDDALQALLLDAGGGETADGNRRTLTPEDRAALRALGYLSPSAASGEPGLDPKVGIRIENRVREVGEALRGGDTAAARQRLDALLADHGDLAMPDFHRLRHELAAARGETEEAVAALRRGVQEFPALAALRWELAGYLAEIGRQGEAEEVARELLAADPRFVQALHLLALGAERRQEWAEALDLYRRALAVEETSVPLRLKVAEMEARLGRLPAARAAYAPLLASGALDDRPEELFRVAMLDARLGDAASAEDLFRRGLALRDGGVHRLAFATLLLQAGRGTEAAEQLRAALDATADPLSDEQRRMARGLLGRLEGAG